MVKCRPGFLGRPQRWSFLPAYHIRGTWHQFFAFPGLQTSTPLFKVVSARLLHYFSFCNQQTLWGDTLRWSTFLLNLCLDHVQPVPVKSNSRFYNRHGCFTVVLVFHLPSSHSRLEGINTSCGCFGVEVADGKHCFYLCREEMVFGANNLSKRPFPNEHLYVFALVLWK